MACEQRAEGHCMHDIMGWVVRGGPTKVVVLGVSFVLRNMIGPKGQRTDPKITVDFYKATQDP